jgi:N-acetylglucosaminyl-diphospho-decaprenol L-rhamnosyltransferase
MTANPFNPNPLNLTNSSSVKDSIPLGHSGECPSSYEPSRSEDAAVAPFAPKASQQPFKVPATNAPQPLYFLSVNYHSAALLSDLMHTLDANQGIVIVNNSPSDRVIQGLAGYTYAGGQVTVLNASENGGFGAGCNLGLAWIYERSPNALVWLINPDARLLPEAVATVRQCFAQQEIAILGTPILDARGKLWFGKGRFNWWTGSISSQGSLNKNNWGRPMASRWVSGCSMVLNFAVLKHCPQFDGVYFLYYEDCDLCERYFQQGAKIAIAPIPLVVHAVSSIAGRYTQPKYVHATFSKLTFLRRHASPLALWLNVAYLFLQSILLRLRDQAAAKGRWLGLMHFLKSPRVHPPIRPDQLL